MTTIKETPKELSRIALNLIEENPEHWNQEVYHEKRSCGTCHCYVGWVEEYLSTTYPEEAQSNLYKRQMRMLDLGDETATFRNIQEVLGLDYDQYGDLVSSTNTYEDLVNYHNEYFNDTYVPCEEMLQSR